MTEKVLMKIRDLYEKRRSEKCLEKCFWGPGCLVLFIVGVCGFALAASLCGVDYRVFGGLEDSSSGFEYCYDFKYDYSRVGNVGYRKSYKLSMNNPNKSFAQAILWGIIKNQYPQDFPRLSPSRIWAVEYDLDEDGFPEIIGVDFNDSGAAQLSYSFYVLKKMNDGYVNISSSSLNIEFDTLRILDTKSNGYLDIQVGANDSGENRRFRKIRYIGS